MFTITEKELQFRKDFIEYAKKTLDLNPSAIQVTLFETCKEEIVPFLIYDFCDNEKEKLFFEWLKNNNKGKIRHVLAMWNLDYGNQRIEIPKGSILKRISELDPANNVYSCVLTYGESGVTGSPLSRFLP